jgi:hypothetical protein
MKESTDGWQIKESELPQWITANKSHLQLFIEEELKEDNKIQHIRLCTSQPSE